MKRVMGGEGGELVNICMREMRGRAGRGKGTSKWEIERKDFLGQRGVEVRNLEEKEREGGGIWEGVEEEERRIQREEREEKIRKGSYNIWYRWYKEEGIPEYLRRGWGEERWNRVARYRLGNEMLERKYWEEDEKKLCRMCGGERETWDHVWERCRSWREGGGGSWQEACSNIMRGVGEGEKWMKEVHREREGGEDRVGSVRWRQGKRESGNVCMNENDW